MSNPQILDNEKNASGPISSEKTLTVALINNRYKVVKQLGIGGMGTVFLVSDQLMNNQLLALKQINQQVLNEDTLKIFKQEFEVMTRLKHPQLVRVFDFGYNAAQDTYYITMEYIDGPSLKNILNQHKKLSLDQVTNLLVDICRVLSFIHSRNIVHRDINPNNIMIDQDGTVKLMDFGLADLGDGETRRKGTIPYMAPEILKGETGPGLDIFALGITLFELLHNEQFYQNNVSQAILGVLSDLDKNTQYLEKRLTELPNKQFNPIIREMIAYCPHDRFQCCTDIILAINRHCNKDYALETETTREAYVLGAGFVGREEELTKLKNKLEKPEQRSEAIWVKGDIGVGKSRLFYEFRNWCQLHDVVFIEGSCFEAVHKEFGPFIPILSELLFQIDEQKRIHFGPELKKILPDHAALKTIAVGPIYDPQTEHINLIQTIVKSLFAFTTRFAEQGCVLYLNDMHWSDEGSIEVINTLLEEMKSRIHSSPNDSVPFHLFWSSRFDGIENLGNIGSPGQCQIITLKPFHKGFVQNYLEAIFGNESLSPQFHRSIPEIQQKVGGNPFFLQELIKSLISNEIIIHNERYWDLDHTLDEAIIPKDLKDLVNMRLKRIQLNPDELTVLQIIALLNRRTTWAELTAIIPVKVSLLRELEQIEILKHEIQRNQSGYFIAHDLIREVIAETMDHRQALHEMIALCLEAVQNHAKVNYIEELAYHFQHAGNRVKALIYLENAAKQAENLFENEKAIKYYYDICSLLTTAEDLKKSNILFTVAYIYLRLGNLPKSIENSRMAGELAEAKKEYVMAAKAYWLLSHSLFESGEQECETRANKSLHMSDLAGNQEYIPKCYNVLGCFYFYTKRDYTKALEYFTRGIEIARVSESKTGLAGNLSNASQVYHALREPRKAIQFVNEALHVYGDTPRNQRSKAIVMGYLIEYHSSAGSYEEAFECYQLGLHLSKKTSSFSAETDIHTRMMKMLFTLKRFDEAQKISEYVNTIIHKTYEYEILFAYHVLAAKLRYVIGDDESASNKLQEMLQASTDQFEIAELTYELWGITKEKEYRNRALSIYNEIIKKSSSHIFKERFQHLQDNKTEYENSQEKGTAGKTTHLPLRSFRIPKSR